MESRYQMMSRGGKGEDKRPMDGRNEMEHTRGKGRGKKMKRRRGKR